MADSLPAHALVYAHLVEKSILVAHPFGQIGTHFDNVFVPIGPEHCKNAVVVHLFVDFSLALFREVVRVGDYKAWSELHYFVQAISKERIFTMRQAVKHLHSADTVSNIESLVDFRYLFDLAQVCAVIIEALIGPAEVPISGIVLCAEGLVTQGVLRATIATDPDVVASINELKL